MQPESAPESLRSLEDLRLFPFTTKQHLRDNYPFGMFAVPREQVVRIHASSGTTGKPTVVGYTQRHIDMWTALLARSIYAAGGRAGDLVHAAYGYGLFTGGLGAHYGAERLGCTVIPVSGGLTERQVQLICDFKPRVIMVTPSYMLAIADELVPSHSEIVPCRLSAASEPVGSPARSQDLVAAALQSPRHYNRTSIGGSRYGGSIETGSSDRGWNCCVAAQFSRACRIDIIAAARGRACGPILSSGRGSHGRLPHRAHRREI
jgi:hypothetical protein